MEKLRDYLSGIFYEDFRIMKLVALLFMGGYRPFLNLWKEANINITNFPTDLPEIQYNYSVAQLCPVTVYLPQNLTHRISKKAAEVDFELVMHLIMQDLQVKQQLQTLHSIS